MRPAVWAENWIPLVFWSDSSCFLTQLSADCCCVCSPSVQLQDLPRLVARLRLSQARPQLPAFKQLHDSIKHVMVLKAAVAALAPRAEAAAAAAAAGAVDDGWQRPESAPGEVCWGHYMRPCNLV